MSAPCPRRVAVAVAMPGWERTGRRSRSMGPARTWGAGSAPGELVRIPGARRRGRRALADVAPDLIHLSYEREQILPTAPGADPAPVPWTEHGTLPRGRRWRVIAGVDAHPAVMRAVARP